MRHESTSGRIGRTVLGVTGTGLMLFSVLLVIMAIGDVITGGDGETTTGTYVGLAVLFSGTAVAGGVMMWKGFRLRRPRGGRLEREQRILALAQANHGRVTIAEVAALCALSVDESKAELDRLQRRGVTDVHLTDTGVLVYTFPGLEP